MTNEINRRDTDYARLLDLDVLTPWSLDRQRVHHGDAAAYEEILALFQAALRSEVVDGDGRLAAPMRARKVEKHLKAAIKAARKQEGAMERLRLAYADHRRTVQALPGQRAAKQDRKGTRRQVAAATAKSLHKSATAFTPASDTAPAVEPSRPAARSINDLFNQQQRRGA